MFTYTEGDESTDGQWELTGTRVYIQDCKSYTGYYQVNANYLDVDDAHVLHLGEYKTLKAAKAAAIEFGRTHK